MSRLDLGRGEQTEILAAIASQTHKIPYSTRAKISLRTLERYLTAYRKEGFAGLLPKTREGIRRLPEELLELAVNLRKENPDRSIERIISMLEASGKASPGLLKRSTLYDHFRRLGLTRMDRPKAETYRRYQAKKRNQRWIGDTCHLLYLPEDGKKYKVYLIAWIDDYSRFVPHAQIYKAERLPMLEDSLKKAAVKFGLPAQVYVDNGAIYSSHHFNRILGHLGIELIHSRPYKAAGRGKIEKFFQFVRASFTSEVYCLMKERQVNLDELNELFFAWLKTYYHERRHSSTKQKPIIRFESDPTPLRHVDLEKLNDAFLLEEERALDKTGVFTINQVPYQVQRDLAREKKILVRYDPYSPERVQVWVGDTRYADATPLVIPEHAGKRKEPPEPEKPSTGMNFLDILMDRHQKEIAKTRIKYRNLEGNPDGACT